MFPEMVSIVEPIVERVRKLETQEPTHNMARVSLPFLIGDRVSVIPVGIHGAIHWVNDCEIKGVSLIADQVGNLTMDIWKDAWPNIPNVADSICAAALPTLAAAQLYVDRNLPGWTTLISYDDIMYIQVQACATITQVTLTLEVMKL